MVQFNQSGEAKNALINLTFFAEEIIQRNKFKEIT